MIKLPKKVKLYEGFLNKKDEIVELIDNGFCIHTQDAIFIHYIAVDKEGDLLLVYKDGRFYSICK